MANGYRQLLKSPIVQLHPKFRCQKKIKLPKISSIVIAITFSETFVRGSLSTVELLCDQSGVGGDDRIN